MTIVLLVIAWSLWVLVANVILTNPRGDVITGVLYHIARAYGLIFHRAKASGLENIPYSRTPGPLVVVANHTAGVDPLLVQSFIRFEPRWMMGKDMMDPALNALWNHVAIIPVFRDGRDRASAREAILHLNAGGVLGVFPEGGIESPPHTLRPFLPGVGLIVARSGAPVLPVFITGTPFSESIFGSFTKRGNAVLVFGPIMRFPGMSASQVNAALEEWYAKISGWPKVDQTLWEKAAAEA